MSYRFVAITLIVAAGSACGIQSLPSSGGNTSTAPAKADAQASPQQPVYDPGPPQPTSSGTPTVPAGSPNTPVQSPNAPVQSPNTPAQSPNVVAPPTQPYVYVGRFDQADPSAVRFAWPNSKIGASFTGSSLSVTLTDTGTDYFNVVLDGKTTVVVQTNPGTTPVTYPIAQNLGAGTHTVWMTKRTEFMQAGGGTYVGTTSFHGFGLSAGGQFQTPPATRTRRLDFIGDSAFTGFGAGDVPPCTYTPGTQNADLSIPAYTGQDLDAEIVNASSSGQGVFQSVYDPDNDHLLPVMYEETVPPGAAPAWNFSQWTADAVVLSAGGDDLAGAPGSGTLPNPAGFTNAYIAWLARIRQHYPQAWIVVALAQSAKGADVVTLGGSLQQAVNTRVAQGDTRVVYFNYYTGTPYTTYDDAASALGLNYGCSYHPSPAGAAWLAGRLSDFIKTKTGW